MAQSWHLAIESSGLGGSVALFEYDQHYRGRLHTTVVLPNDRGSVQTLAPAIEEALATGGIKPKQLSSLSVTAGPGSFTGLRVGLATAKMLSWTLSIPVVPVDTLETIAARFVQSASTSCRSLPNEYRLVAAINAFRRQVFTSSWLVRDRFASRHLPSVVVDANRWMADPWQAENIDSQWPLFISGGALATYQPSLATAHLADSQLWQPLAEQVGMLGLRGLESGNGVSAQHLDPNYIRSSAAEENLNKPPA